MAFQANVLKPKRVHERLVMDAVLAPATFATSFILKKTSKLGTINQFSGSINGISKILHLDIPLRLFKPSRAAFKAMDVQFEARILCNSKPLCCRWDPIPRGFLEHFLNRLSMCLHRQENQEFLKSKLEEMKNFRILIPGAVNPSHSHLGWRLNYAYEYFFPSKTLKTNMDQSTTTLPHSKVSASLWVVSRPFHTRNHQSPSGPNISGILWLSANSCTALQTPGHKRL